MDVIQFKNFNQSEVVTHLKLVLLFFVVFLITTTDVFAEDEDESKYQQLKIADPYVELHTGPGRGYPIFHVVKRHEMVEVLKRKTDWFKIRADRNKQGWVHRDQIERTLSEAGYPKTFRDIVYDDFLHRRIEFGISAGELERDPIIAARLGFRFNDNLAAELTAAQVAGDLSSSKLYTLNIVSTPFPDWRITPNFTIGVGRFENKPRATLVQDVDTDSDLANAGVGARFYLTRRFFLRGDYRRYVVLSNDDNNDEFDEISGGFAFFF